MKELEFKVKSYSKMELARLYNPVLCDRVAARTFLQWIDRNVELTKRLLETGFKRTDRMITPKQVEIIVHYLGEPSY